MALKKQRVLPDEYVVKQGDDGKTAFLIVSGALSVEIDGKTIGFQISKVFKFTQQFSVSPYS